MTREHTGEAKLRLIMLLFASPNPFYLVSFSLQVGVAGSSAPGRRPGGRGKYFVEGQATLSFLKTKGRKIYQDYNLIFSPVARMCENGQNSFWDMPNRMAKMFGDGQDRRSPRVATYVR